MALSDLTDVAVNSSQAMRRRAEAIQSLDEKPAPHRSQQARLAPSSVGNPDRFFEQGQLPASDRRRANYKTPESLMCHFSRCIQKIEGQLRYYPCPVIYDDPRFELGATLEESFRRVHIGHKNCYDYCLKGRGATCRTQAV